MTQYTIVVSEEVHKRLVVKKAELQKANASKRITFSDTITALLDMKR